MTVVGRRDTPLHPDYASLQASPKLVTKIVGVASALASLCRDNTLIDFENLPAAAFEGHDVAFCALGSTRAQAGSAVRVKCECVFVFA